MNDTELGQLVLVNRKGHAEQGCHLISGATTVTGNFYIRNCNRY